MSTPLLKRLLGIFEPQDSLSLGSTEPTGATAAQFSVHRRRGFRMLLASPMCEVAHQALRQTAQQYVQQNRGLIVFHHGAYGLSRQEVIAMAIAHQREHDLICVDSPDDLADYERRLGRQSIVYVHPGRHFDASLIHLCQSLKKKRFGRGEPVLLQMPHVVMAYAGIQHELNLYGRKQGVHTIYIGPDFRQMDATNRAHLPQLLRHLEVRAITAHTPPETAQLLGLAPDAPQRLPANTLLLLAMDQAPQVVFFPPARAAAAQAA